MTPIRRQIEEWLLDAILSRSTKDLRDVLGLQGITLIGCMASQSSVSEARRMRSSSPRIPT